MLGDLIDVDVFVFHLQVMFLLGSWTLLWLMVWVLYVVNDRNWKVTLASISIVGTLMWAFGMLG